MRAHNAIYLYDAMFIAIDAALPNNAQLDREALRSKLKTNFWQEQRINRAQREKHNKILCSQVVTGARYRCFLGGIRTKSPFNQWVTGGLTLFHQTGMVQPQVVEVV